MSSIKNIEKSLFRQKKIISASIVLNPVENFPLFINNYNCTNFVQGLYVTDKIRSENKQKTSKILFGGRERAIKDTQFIYKYWSSAFGGRDGTMRLLSGLHAHIVLFMSIGKIGDKIIILPVEAGGHFSTKAILSRLGFEVIEAEIDYNHFCIDLIKTRKKIQEYKPKFIFIDRSEGLWFEDFSTLLNEKTGYKVFDISHYVPQILFGNYNNPLSSGADLLVFTLHKSFPGPQKAMIISKELNSTWSLLVQGLGEFVSNLHVANTYLAGLAIMDQEKLSNYNSLLLKNALYLEEELLSLDVPVFDRSIKKKWPPTHHIWITIGNATRAFALFKQLEFSRIFVNYRLLPYGLGYGLRLGTTGATIQGLTPEFIPELAKIISQVFKDGHNLRLRHKVHELSQAMSKSALVNLKDM